MTTVGLTVLNVVTLAYVFLLHALFPLIDIGG